MKVSKRRLLINLLGNIIDCELETNGGQLINPVNWVVSVSETFAIMDKLQVCLQFLQIQKCNEYTFQQKATMKL